MPSPRDNSTATRPHFIAWLFLVITLGFAFVWWARHSTTPLANTPKATSALRKVSLRNSIGKGPIRSSSKLNLDPDKNVYPNEPPPGEIYQDLLKHFTAELEQLKQTHSTALLDRAVEFCKTRKEWKNREDSFLKIAIGWEKMDDETRAQHLPEVEETLNYATAAIRDALAEIKSDPTTDPLKTKTFKAGK
jgi:hypothetical protein